jgi:hypothetical protein
VNTGTTNCMPSAGNACGGAGVSKGPASCHSQCSHIDQILWHDNPAHSSRGKVASSALGISGALYSLFCHMASEASISLCVTNDLSPAYVTQEIGPARIIASVIGTLFMRDMHSASLALTSRQISRDNLASPGLIFCILSLNLPIFS